MEKNHLPNVLVISRNCFSKSGSNGRTLGNLFYNYPREKIAQFFTYPEQPDKFVCENFYRITDFQALKSFFKRKPAYSSYKNISTDIQKKKKIKKLKQSKHSPLTLFLKEMIWNSNKWISRELFNWIKDFQPDVIVLFVGGLSYLPNFAMKISDLFDLPIIVFNTEGYYFQKRNYTIETKMWPLFNYFNKKRFKKSFEKLMGKAKYVIHSCDKLKDDFDKLFVTPSCAIYTSSYLECKNKVVEDYSFLYAGNLGLDRYKSLIRIGNFIYNNGGYHIDVYGKATEKIIEVMKQCPGILYHGIISYDEVAEAINNSRVLLHVETFEKKYEKGLKYAFSTKIADYLASNKCFIIYAPSSLACVEYLLKNECAHVCTTKEILEITLDNVLKSKEFCGKYVDNSKKVYINNHLNTHIKFELILKRVMEEQ